MGSGPALNTVVSPGGKGFRAGEQRDPFNEAYNLGGGGKGGPYTPPGYDQRIAGYEAQRNQLDAQAAQNLALRQNYSSPYVDNFQQFTGNYSYQQPYYMPPPQQFYSPPQQYYSPYMNQFQMAGSQFYQQPYSYQPQPSFYQPFSQMGGRSQMFGQQLQNQFRQPENQMRGMQGQQPQQQPERIGQVNNTIVDPETGRSFVVGGPMQQDLATGQAYKRAMANAGLDGGSQQPQNQFGSMTGGFNERLNTLEQAQQPQQPSGLLQFGSMIGGKGR